MAKIVEKCQRYNTKTQKRHFYWQLLILGRTRRPKVPSATETRTRRVAPRHARIGCVWGVSPLLPPFRYAGMQVCSLSYNNPPASRQKERLASSSLDTRPLFSERHRRRLQTRGLHPRERGSAAAARPHAGSGLRPGRRNREGLRAGQRQQGRAREYGAEVWPAGRPGRTMRVAQREPCRSPARGPLQPHTRGVARPVPPRCHDRCSVLAVYSLASDSRRRGPDQRRQTGTTMLTEAVRSPRAAREKGAGGK